MTDVFCIVECDLGIARLAIEKSRFSSAWPWPFRWWFVILLVVQLQIRVFGPLEKRIG
jgi:hypothetical protein